MAFYIDESSNIQWGLDQSTGGVTFRTQLKNDEITSVRGEELQINDILEFGGGNACSDACMADSDGYAIGLKLNGITFDENRQQWDVNGGFVYLDNSAVVPFEKLDSTATSCTTGASFAGTDLIPKVDGCTNPVASNYDPDATYDDGSCILTPLSVVADSILEELGCPPTDTQEYDTYIGDIEKELVDFGYNDESALTTVLGFINEDCREDDPIIDDEDDVVNDIEQTDPTPLDPITETPAYCDGGIVGVAEHLIQTQGCNANYSQIIFALDACGMIQEEYNNVYGDNSALPFEGGNERLSIIITPEYYEIMVQLYEQVQAQIDLMCGQGEDGEDYEGTSSVDPIDSGYNDSGTTTIAQGIPTALSNSYTNLNSKLRGYFELVEEVQYKLDETKKDLDTTLDLCKDGEGVQDACTTAEELAAYVQELEDKLANMTTSDDALAALLEDINSGTTEDYNFQTTAQISTKINELETEIDTLQAEAVVTQQTITDNDLLISQLQGELDDLGTQITNAGLDDLDALLAAYSTSLALNAQLESFALSTMTALDSTFSAQTLTDLENFTSDLDLDASMSADFVNALTAYASSIESTTASLTEIIDGNGNVVSQAGYDSLVIALTNTTNDFNTAISDNALLQADIDAAIEAADAESGYSSISALNAVQGLILAQSTALESLEGQLNELQASFNNLETQYNGLAGAAGGALTALGTLFGATVDTETNLSDQLTDAITQTSSAIAALLAQINSEIELEEGATIADAVSALIDAYQLSDDGYTLESQNSAVQAALDALDQAISQDPTASGSSQADLVADIVSMHQEIADLQVENSILESQGGTSSQQVADLQATILQLQSNNAVLQEDIASYIQEIADINTALGGVQAEIDKFDQLSELLGTELNSLSNYLARYGYQPTDFSVDDASSMFYDQDTDNLTVVEDQDALDTIGALTWDGTLSNPTADGVFSNFAGGNGRRNMYSNYCAQRTGGMSIMPLLDWGIEMKNFYDNAVIGNNTNNMRNQTLSYSGQATTDRECQSLPDLTTVNTGSNMTIFVNSAVSKVLSGAIYDPSSRIYAVTRDGDVVGAGRSTSKEQSFPVWGKDATVADLPDEYTQGDLQIVDPSVKPTDFKPTLTKPTGKDYGAEEGEMIFFRVLYKNKIMKIMSSHPNSINGELAVKYTTNGIFNFDDRYTYKLEELCYIDYLAGIEDTTPTPPSTMSIWAKGALIVGSVYILNRLLRK